MVFIHLLLPPFPGDRNHFYEGVSQTKKLIAEREVVIKVILSVYIYGFIILLLNEVMLPLLWRGLGRGYHKILPTKLSLRTGYTFILLIYLERSSFYQVFAVLDNFHSPLCSRVLECHATEHQVPHAHQHVS